MAFNSWTFLTFFLVVLGLHRLPLPWTAKKVNLLLASYLFYAAWSPPYVLLLWFTSAVDWSLARAIAASRALGVRRRLLGLSLLTNLGVLSYFKYGEFVRQNFTLVLHRFGVEFHSAPGTVLLPMGISFYTFVTLAYTIDVYRGVLKPTSSLLDYCLLVSFFPHLVAGPILRADTFLPQCAQPRNASAQQFGWGTGLLVLGLFEKMVLADLFLAPIADKVYAAPNGCDTLQAWLGTMAFAGQIFCDFDGYSMCAMGAALCLGFAFPDNFRFPYGAVGFSDFWRRWHISLSTWLRDYLYVSLGGNRRGTARTYLNLSATMLLGGLWHGASWNYVLWGGLHGACLMAERWLRTATRMRLPDLLGALLTFALTSMMWVFFRLQDPAAAWHMLATMVTLREGPPLLRPFEMATVVVLIGGMFALHWGLRDTSWEEFASRLPRWVVSGALAFMLMALSMTSGDDRAFIYFRF